MSDVRAPDRRASAGHAGELAVAVARAHGVETMFTLSGRPRLPDVRRCGQGRSADADPRRAARADRGLRRRGDRQAHPGARASPCSPPVRASPTGSARSPRPSSPGSPMVVVGGRAPQNRWGSGSLQELDQPPIVASDHQGRAHDPDRGRGRRRVRRRVPRRRLVPPRPGVRRRPDGRVLQHRDRPSRPRRRRPAAPTPTPTPSTGSPALLADAERPVLILGTDVWADGAERDGARARRGRRPPRRSPTAWGAASSPAATRCWSPRHAARRSTRADLVVVVGTPARLPARVRRVRRQGGRRAGPRRPRRRLPRPGLAATRRSPTPCPGTWPRCSAGWRRRSTAPTARSLEGLGRGPAGHRPGGGGPRRRAAHRRGRPDPSGPHLRRAAPAARRRRGRDRRRRRLRQLRREVRRAAAPRRLARPRALRLPRRRPRLGDRGPARAAVGAGRAAARRRCRRLLADGRRHPGPPRPAGRDGDGQQLRLGPGEGPDADDLRLRRRRRPRAADPVRRGGQGARWGRGDG